MTTTVSLVNIHHQHSYNFFLGMRTFKIYSCSNFHIYNTVLLIIVNNTVHYIPSTYFISGSLNWWSKDAKFLLCNYFNLLNHQWHLFRYCQFLYQCAFSVPESHTEFMSPQSPLICDSSLLFPCLSWPWLFWRVMVEYFAECPSNQVCLLFSHSHTGVMSNWEDTT